MSRPTAAVSPSHFTTFGALLRYLRQRQRMTQIDLAIATGYSTGQISRLEQNQRLPNPSVLRALFVPALALDHAPELVERLLELAEAARTAAPSEFPELRAANPADAQPGSTAAQGPAALPAVPLLLSKLFVPRPRASLVPRTRLLERLASARELPLSLIAAPAGFGKTMLLAEWLASGAATSAARALPVNQNHVAWLQLDDGDNDPATFVRYVIAALQPIATGVGAGVLPLLQGAQAPAPELLARALLNDLLLLPDATLLVLDDYHLVTAPGVHAVLTAMLAHLPPQVHLVLSTRADPPLPLARLRARGQILELRAADLRFTSAEARPFLRDVMGLALAPDEIAALELRTEGWIAGLQLAALAMRDRGDVAGFISAFAGSNRFVVDYLAGEVFERQPRHIQTFLLHTAILERMCGPLCDAVMGLEAQSAGGGAAFTQALLEEVERANLFVVPLDDTRGWYRYHHLFGAVLRERLLSGASADEVAQLHCRAAAWYDAAGFVDEALHHALVGRDWERAATILEHTALVRIVNGQVHTVLGWLAALPADVLRRHPTLGHGQAVGLMAINQFDAAETRLRDIEAHLDVAMSDDLRQLIVARLFGLRAHIRLFKGDFVQSHALISKTLALLPEAGTSTATRNLLTLTRVASVVYGAAAAYKASGDVTAAVEQHVADSIAPAQSAGNTAGVTNGWVYLAYLRMLQGRLRLAETTYGEIERQGVGRDLLPELIGSPGYFVGMGELLRQWDQLDAAESYLQRGMELLQAPRATDADMIVLGHAATAFVQQARGAHDAARATMDRLLPLAHARQFYAGMVERAQALRARLDLMQGALAGAVRWADASGLDPDMPAAFPREAALLTLARVRIAQGRPSEVLPLLARYGLDAEAKGRRHSAIEIRVLEALAFQAQGNWPAAVASLHAAVQLAEPEGYIRVFVDEGRPMAVLLERAARAPTLAPYAAYIARLRSALPGADAAVSTSAPAAAPTLIEPLSARELETLRLIAAGLSNAAIAAQLVVGVSTVKKHVNNLFGKLGVQSRTQALARARDLGLL